VDDLRAFFECLAEEWDVSQPPDRVDVLRRMLAPFETELWTAESILEVGAGTGALIPRIRERAPIARIVSIDLAYAMLRHARQRCPDASLVQCDVHWLPFISGSIKLEFDWVICHNSFPHFVHPPAALDEIARVLCRDGQLLIVHDLSREQVNAIHQGIQDSIVHNDLLPRGVELARMLETHGFEVVQFEDSTRRYAMHARILPEKRDDTPLYCCI
jgi:ubiquinone/menaquinone biosynthesis C-methylase UbiE